MTTLAERKAQAGKHLPRDTFTVTFLSGEALFEEVKALTNTLTDLRVQAQRLDREIEAEADNPKPRKGADKDTPATRKAALDAQIAEAEARIVAITEDEIPEHQEEIELVGMTSGEWQRWRDAHPARIIGYREVTRQNGDVEQGDPTYHPDDLELTKTPWSLVPSCNAADVDEKLLDRFIVKVGGEALESGGWSAWLADAILWQDRRSLIRTAVGISERAMIRLPKALTSRPTTSDSRSSVSPEPSESPASDS